MDADLKTLTDTFCITEVSRQHSWEIDLSDLAANFPSLCMLTVAQYYFSNPLPQNYLSGMGEERHMNGGHLENSVFMKVFLCKVSLAVY